MEKNMEREVIERTCRRWLQIAAKSIDEGKDTVWSGYSWAYNKMDGLATGLLDLYLFDLYNIANYYRRIADNRMFKKY